MSPAPLLRLELCEGFSGFLLCYQLQLFGFQTARTKRNLQEDRTNHYSSVAMSVIMYTTLDIGVPTSLTVMTLSVRNIHPDILILSLQATTAIHHVVHPHASSLTATPFGDKFIPTRIIPHNYKKSLNIKVYQKNKKC